MRIYGPTLSNARLQDCFYSLYVPEVEACAGLLVDTASKDKSLKHHVKGVPKLAKTYLLDKLELNTKARCVLAWSGMSIQSVRQRIVINYDIQLLLCVRSHIFWFQAAP